MFISLVVTLSLGCTSGTIDETRVLDPQEKVSFAANDPKGAMVLVTIDLNSIVFKNKEEKERISLPDLSELSVIKGWFLYNVDVVEAGDESEGLGQPAENSPSE